MSATEAQKRAIKKYQSTKTKQLSLRLLMKEYEKLLDYANKHNTTPNGVIRDRIADIIKPE